MAGVAAGIAHAIRIDPMLIRAAFVVLCFAQGAGAVIYVLALALSIGNEEISARPARSGTREVLGVACVVAGLLLLFRQAGLWFGDAVVWPLATIALGSTFVWVRADIPRAGDGKRLSDFSGFIRLAVGFGLVLVGIGLVLVEYSPLSLGRVVFPITVAIAGLLLALGPWLLRLSRQAAEERRARIRSEERAAVAAHLHDSVLQTLALIQRTGSSPEVATLARQQERELRAWLYGKSPDSEVSTFKAALDLMAARMEKTHRVPIEAVIVGDAPLDDETSALVQAAGEAMNNAGRHSGASAVSVFAEVEPRRFVVYVRDSGTGFDPGAVSADRRGIVDSIVGRVARTGGTAEIISEPGSGTEVRMEIPRRRNE